MTDIATTWLGNYGGWQASRPGLAEDDGLDTALLISLFTDRRAEADDELPDGGDDRRGWWGDSYPDIEGDKIGSRLWLLNRSKLLTETVIRAKEYAGESLTWLTIDGVANAVNVTTERVGATGLALAIAIHRPDKPLVRYRFERYWTGI